MIFRRVEQLPGTRREATGEGWRSLRLLLAEDGLGFSVHETKVKAGTVLNLCYRRHSETVYCIRGRARLEIVAEGRSFEVGPGVLYLARIGDSHVLTVEEDSLFLCVFRPALCGREEAD
ncbi:MAG: ectoine synthase [Lysobacterales bacterium]|jgi:L-ectoine synthase